MTEEIAHGANIISRLYFIALEFRLRNYVFRVINKVLREFWNTVFVRQTSFQAYSYCKRLLARHNSDSNKECVIYLTGPYFPGLIKSVRIKAGKIKAGKVIQLGIMTARGPWVASGYLKVVRMRLPWKLIVQIYSKNLTGWKLKPSYDNPENIGSSKFFEVAQSGRIWAEAKRNLKLIITREVKLWLINF